MRTRLIIGIVVVAIIILVGIIFVKSLVSQHKSTVSISGHAFHITVANTEQQKEIGLSNTTSLSKDQGMLFPFNKPDYYGFWMRNMKYPLDIIYISNKKIVSIANNVFNPNNPASPLPIYRPSQPADTVLEINGGLSNTYHFSIGDKVSISL